MEEREGFGEGTVHRVKRSKTTKMNESGEATAMCKGDLREARLQRACENSGLQEERDGAPTVRFWGSEMAQDEKKGEMQTSRRQRCLLRPSKWEALETQRGDRAAVLRELLG